MELFSEIYGSYYSAMAKVLRGAWGEGLTRRELDHLVGEHAFSESGLHLIPRLLSGEWNLLRQQDSRLYSRLAHADTSLPLTALQKAWLKALLADRRIRLFAEDGVLEELARQLREVEPLFMPDDFHIFDAATDGDDYTDEGYVARFRLVLRALRESSPLRAGYTPPREGLQEMDVLPRRMLYSTKDDKFRLEGLRLTETAVQPVILNMARIQSLALSTRQVPVIAGHPPQRDTRYSVRIAISGERNALERCMLQFTAYDKQTVWDEESGRHICDIHYNAMEETELLIRLLSFGPVIEVLGPERFLRQVRRRVHKQTERLA